MKTNQTSCVTQKSNIKTKTIVESKRVNKSFFSYMRKPISYSEGNRMNTMIKQKTATLICSSNKIKFEKYIRAGPEQQEGQPRMSYSKTDRRNDISVQVQNIVTPVRPDFFEPMSNEEGYDHTP